MDHLQASKLSEMQLFYVKDSLGGMIFSSVNDRHAAQQK